jgi:hypothetical protein
MIALKCPIPGEAKMKKHLLAAVAALALGGPAIADPTPQEIDELRAMHPITPDAARLPSHSTIGHLRPGFKVVLGHDAAKSLMLPLIRKPRRTLLVPMENRNSSTHGPTMAMFRLTTGKISTQTNSSTP